MSPTRCGGSNSVVARAEADVYDGNPDAIIVGAGPAGLACAVTMRAAGLSVTVLEKADSVGSVWRRHYDRLHLHTDRKHSGLPGMAMPQTYPAYPSREQMVDVSRKLCRALRYPAGFQHDGVAHPARGRAMARGDRRKARSPRPWWSLRPASPTRRIAVMAGLGSLSRLGHPQQRLSQSRALCGQARAGGRLRQFRRRDRARSRQCRRRCRAGGSRPGADLAARSAGLSDPVVGDSVPALARAAGRS